MKKGNVTEFNAYLNAQVGQPYCWGCQHTMLTPDNYEAVITRKESDAVYRLTAISYCKARFDMGATVLYAYDCSGLGMYWLQNLKKIYTKDMNANSMMGKCEMVDTPKNGYWVFRISDGKATHIGYMVTDTEVIHAKGRDKGVCRERYVKSYWHRVGKPNCIEFDNPEPKPEPTLFQIKVKGSVRVRDGNGVLHKKIATVKNCYLPFLGVAEEYPNWFKTSVDGQDGYITSNPKYTEIVEA